MKNKIKASVLPTVLFVSVLLLSLLLMLFFYTEIFVTLNELFHRERQNNYYIKSGQLLQSTDSLFYSKLDTQEGYVLLDNDNFSKIYVHKKDWGLYETVSVLSYDKKQCETMLYGRTSENYYKAALWVSNRKKNLDLAGTSELEGDIYVGMDIYYSRVRDDFYKGGKIDPSRIKKNSTNLPTLISDKAKYINELFKQEDLTHLDYKNLPTNSFLDKTIKVFCSGTLRDIRLKGNYIITGKDLYVDSTCALKDVIIVSNSVVFGEGFTGNIQIFAKDSVILKNNVQLTYPSGIYVENSSSNKPKIVFNDSSSLCGYVVMNLSHKSEVPNVPNLVQSQKSRINGLVYINGIAQISGEVSGAIYLKDSYYYSNEGYYSNIIYNLKVKRDSSIAYPILMVGPYEKKMIKWLY